MSISEETSARVVKAKSAQVSAATEIWNARLEILRSVGDFRGMLDHLRTPVELAGDNCGCNSACSIPEGMSGINNPMTRK